MKKLLLIGLLCFLILSGCSGKTKRVKSTGTTDSSSSITTTDETKPNKTSTSTTVASSAIQVNESTLETNTPVEDTQTVPEITTTEVNSQEQAMEVLKQFLNNEDIGFTPWGQEEDSFVFKAQSKSLAEQGGSGTVGFYRVHKNGTVNLLESAP